MSVSSETVLQPSLPGRNPTQPSPTATASVYGRAFWCTYVSNSALMVAISLMYRYADFVLYLGGTEWNVGLIVGIGMIGSLAMRLFQGFGIDHFGARKIWLCSMVLFALSVLGHVFVNDAHGPAIFVLRILYTISVAGAFGASITSVSRELPLERLAEVIGSLGTSGFIAMALGPLLGDALCGHEKLTRWDLDLMFCVAAGLGTVSLGLAELATRHQPLPRRRRKPPMLWILRRYHPGSSMLLLAVLLGIGFVIPTTFLPTYTKELGIEHMGAFFMVYAGTAFLTRISTRRFPEHFGVRPMILLGLGALALSFLCYLPVTSVQGLIMPGFFAGIAHAVLFPCITARGSAGFPSRYRGLGTTLMLSALDLGALVGAPVVGRMVEYSKSAQLPPYSTTFLVLAAGVMLSAIGYALTDRR